MDFDSIRTTAEKRFDVAIVGADITGCIAAVAFAHQGRSVLLLDHKHEQSLAQPSHILHPGGIAALEKLGLRSALDNIETFPVRGYTVHRQADSANVFFSLPHRRDGWDEKGPRSIMGLAFRREKLMVQLRRLARHQCNVVMVEATVTQIVRGGMSDEVLGVECIRSHADYPVHFLADLTLLCDGTDSTLRDAFSTPPVNPPTAPAPNSPALLNRYWAFDIPHGALPVEEMVCSILDAAGCNLTLFRISRDTLRAHIEVTPTLAASLAAHPDTSLRDHLITNVSPLMPLPLLAEFRLAVGSARMEPIALGLRCAETNYHPGVFLLHDQPYTSDLATDSGLMVALKDVALLVGLLKSRGCCKSLANSWRIRLALAKFLLKRKKHTAPLDMVSRVLRDWDSGQQITRSILRRSIVKFLAKGDRAYHAPIQSLAGMLQKRRRLFKPLVRLTSCAVQESLARARGVYMLVAWCRVVGIVWLACHVAVVALFDDILG
ncbi:Squalene monooxygenase 1,1 [Ceratocystis fimbriata CBS 114723]|uniref:Squalene monooxygenase n=1 Tax=Ceratocystis fimbriata CBS 114723 TaxID=1035309 RepID=A0A2C5XA69_9PEZI|nr:Squalene monooxygenase 1,1 [Ceratocystis fimbriata CBS 114723]